MILQEVFETADLLDLLNLLVAGDPYLTKPNQQPIPTGSMYAIYGNIYHQYTPNVSIYTIHGSYGIWISMGMTQDPIEWSYVKFTI